jgi:UDP-glucose 4-epimerase
MSRTAIVTGGAGFVGSHLVDSLLRDGYRAIVVDDLSTGDLTRLAQEAEVEPVSFAGAGGAAAFDALVEKARPDCVFHLGGQASVIVSVEDPAHDMAVNVGGTLNVLRAASSRSVPVVFTSTGGVYGNAPVPTRENVMPVPTAPYGASKLAAEGYVRMFSRSSRTPHAVCRPGVIYGPRQNPHGESGAVARFSHQLWSGVTPVLYGSGEPTRDYVHVIDVVEALRRVSGMPGTFNVATGVETKTSELLAALQRVAGTAVEPELAPLREGEIKRSCLDPERTARTLGWRARMTLADGLVGTYPALVLGFEHDGVPAQA